MTLRLRFLVLSLVALGVAPALAWAQMTAVQDVYLRAKPVAKPASGTLDLSLKDAIERGLAQNLGTVLQEARVGGAEGDRTRALSDLLPHLSLNARESVQTVNLAAFGFSGFPGIPPVIGPFTVFDARVGISAPVLDIAASRRLGAATAARDAEKFSAQNARELVILAVANLYLEALADASRVESAKAQVATAQALVTLAQDQQSSGIVAGIEVLRQQVQLEAARQRQISSENQLEKRKLSLGRAIGLPASQTIALTDQLSDQAPPPLERAAALAEALKMRDDVKSAESRASAARATKEAAAAGVLPTIHVDGDAGAAGSSAANSTGVFTVAASVHVPIFEGGATKGRVAQADADLKQREAELADLKSGVEYEVSAAFLDIASSTAAMETARSGRTLAQRQLDQAQDRFRAGVASTIELVQAQDALATATELYISSLYGNQIAKAELARAIGLVETRFADFVGGAR